MAYSITQRGAVLEAADAASSDYFGASVALSADGQVLAVGAYYWEGAAVTNTGGVYVYDRNGSGWTQRGSVLEAADAESADYFGVSVALSADGQVLAVGAYYWEGAVGSNRGGVYVYDRNGSGWTQRGSVLEAADAADTDNFGISVALSDDGQVLAVGAHLWEGAAGLNRGGVYVYDRNGSGWTQNGSVLEAADAADGDNFGVSVALSSDAGVLSVGAWSWEGAAGTNRGGVYVYDVAGITQKLAGALDAQSDLSGAPSNDASIALEGTLDATSNASAAGVIQPPAGTIDAAADAAATLTAGPILSGTVAAQGEATGELSNPTRALQGTADAAADAAGALAKDAAGTADAAADAAAAPSRNLAGTQDAAANLNNTGYLTPQEDALARASAPIIINVQANGAATAPVKIDVQSATGTATAPIRINVRGTGSATAPIVIAVVSSLSVQSWTLAASIGGADVSANLTGQISVRMEEGGSRTAEFSLHVASTPVNPLAYVGKDVSIDLVRMISGVAVSAPLFRGVVESPTYQPRAALLQLSCSQDLQHIIAALERSVIDGITGGGYHRAVHGDVIDNWDYAQACMSTQPASLDCGVMGNPRKTPWDGLPVWKTFGVSEIDEPDIGIEFPRRADLVNQVDCSFEYRYHHLRERHEWLGWSGSWFDVDKTGPDQFPTVQDIEAAISGTGWQIVSGVYYGLPERVPYADGYLEIPRTACGNASVHAAQRHSQTVTESSTLRVTAPTSIANSGTIARELRGTLASEWSPAAWESDIYAPLTGVAEAAAAGVTPFAGGFSGGYAATDDLAATSGHALGGFAQVPAGYSGGNMEMDWAPDAPRADAEAGILSLLNTAKVMILGSHRHARVSAAFEILPELDTDRAAAISIGSLSVTGKVVAVEHVLDIESGEASTRFTLAPSGIGAAGLITETPVAPPVVDAAALLKNAAGEDIYSVPVLGSHRAGLSSYTDSLMGWLVNPPKTLTIVDVPDGQGNLIEKTVDNPYYTPDGYPVTGFRVKMPGVADARRNPAKTSVSQDYLVQIPEDTFSL